jgi:ADP-glucose pyrophosphorylase
MEPGGQGQFEFVLPSPPASGERYAGTADAVLQNLILMKQHHCEFALILSADHVYRMDYRGLLNIHAASLAEATIATVDHPREFSTETGVLDVDDHSCVVGFEEKPQHPRSTSKREGMVSASMGAAFRVDARCSYQTRLRRSARDYRRKCCGRCGRRHRIQLEAGSSAFPRAGKWRRSCLA